MNGLYAADSSQPSACQVFNNTPDETAFYRLTLEREAVQPSMLMVQPSLTSFTFDGPPQPVLLDVASMRLHPLSFLLLLLSVTC